MRVARLSLILLLLSTVLAMTLLTGCGGEPVGQPVAEEQPIVQENLDVHFLDVGQGDAILVDKKDTEILIDGGPEGSGVADKIKSYVDGPLELMILTHPHADHTGCLDDVLVNYQVQKVWFGSNTSQSKSYRDYTLALNDEANSGVELKTVQRNYSLDIGGMTLTVLHPTEPSSGDSNNDSVVIQLTYNSVSFLFTGDAEKDAEASMVNAGVVKDINILKAGHHGSDTSSSQAMINKCKPEVAVVSVGEGNTYKHPNAETLQRIQAAGATIYRTDISGTITVTTDGTKWSMSKEK